jgi:hypothetical protein
MTLSADELKKLVAEAEAAVAAVKDPELRTAAFEKILDRLLLGGEPQPAKSKAKHATRAEAAPAKKATGGPKGRIEELIADGFFKKQRRTLADVKAELANRGFHFAWADLGNPLQRLCKQRRLRRQKASVGDKTIYSYSEW